MKFKRYAPKGRTLGIKKYGRKEKRTFRYFPLEKEGNWFLGEVPLEEGDRYTLLLDGRYEMTDPLARATDLWGRKSMVLRRKTEAKPLEEPPKDVILYEVHVKDYTYLEDHPHPGTFQAMEDHLDHLEELGVTYLHLLPLTDFPTMSPDPYRYLEEDNYNWGYDPEHFRVLYPGYGTDPEDPEKTLEECKSLIKACHKLGMGVIFDMVFNHTYRTENHPFYLLAPEFYRRGEEGKPANGSGVGNELATEHPVLREFLLDTLTYFVEELGVDGFRFDLMALLDREFLLEAQRRLKQRNPHVLLYGEPWSALPSALPEDLQWAPGEIPYFLYDDRFRNALVGSPFGDPPTVFCGGWEEVLGPLLGEEKGKLYYLNCHDDYILWDQLVLMNPEDNEEVLGKKYRFLLTLLALAQGPILLTAGNEWRQSKGGRRNTYDGPSSINALKREEKWNHYGTWKYLQELLEFRKETLLRRGEGAVVSMGENTVLLERFHGKIRQWIGINRSGGEETILLGEGKTCIFSREGKSLWEPGAEDTLKPFEIRIYQ